MPLVCPCYHQSANEGHAVSRHEVRERHHAKDKAKLAELQRIGKDVPAALTMALEQNDAITATKEANKHKRGRASSCESPYAILPLHCPPLRASTESAESLTLASPPPQLPRLSLPVKAPVDLQAHHHEQTEMVTQTPRSTSSCRQTRVSQAECQTRSLAQSSSSLTAQATFPSTPRYLLQVGRHP